MERPWLSGSSHQRQIVQSKAFFPPLLYPLVSQTWKMRDCGILRLCPFLPSHSGFLESPDIWPTRGYSKACIQSPQTRDSRVSRCFALPKYIWWTALKSYLISRLFNSSDFHSYPEVFTWLFLFVPLDCKCSRARIGSLAHFNYRTGWCTPYFKDGTTTIQPCASNAAPGLDLSPRYADVCSHVSCKISS